MAVGELVGYASFPWDKIRRGADPLDLVRAQQLRVYIKFDTTRYVARTKSSNVAFLEKQRSSVHERGLIGGWRRAPELPDSLQPVWDCDICLLALDDSSIAEIRSTGDCAVSVFKWGGLKAVGQANTSNAVGARVSGEQAPRYENVPFAECFLVERSRMVEHEVPMGIFSEISRLDRHAVQMRIGREDLYFEKDQLERVGWAGSDYPPKDGKERPSAIILLYRVSVALNSGLIRPRVVDEQKKRTQASEEVVKWLEGNAPEIEAKGALKRTARTIASKDYNRIKNFDEQGLAKFPGSEHVPVENLSLPVRFALAITEWWVGFAKQRHDRRQLLIELCAVGFEKTAAFDLVEMISGKPVPRNERDAQWEKAEKVLSFRERRKLRGEASRKILRKSSASGQPARATAEGADE